MSFIFKGPMKVMTALIFLSLSSQAVALSENIPVFSELQDANDKVRAEFSAWVNKLTERMKVKEGSLTFYGIRLENEENEYCGLGFDGRINNSLRFYIFLGEGKNCIDRAVDIPVVNYQAVEITMNKEFIELRSVYSIQGYKDLRDYRLRIEIGESGFPIKAIGKVYYEDDRKPYENTCVFPTS